jgi:hypothetical protein
MMKFRIVVRRRRANSWLILSNLSCFKYKMMGSPWQVLHCPVITPPMATHIIGGHPNHGKPAGVCGTFSFKGNAKDLYFIWPVPGGLMAAWFRSVVLGTTTITFHPSTAINQNGLICYQVWIHIVMGAVPVSDTLLKDAFGSSSLGASLKVTCFDCVGSTLVDPTLSIQSDGEPSVL